MIYIFISLYSSQARLICDAGTASADRLAGAAGEYGGTELVEAIRSSGAHLVCLAGFMRVGRRVFTEGTVKIPDFARRNPDA